MAYIGGSWRSGQATDPAVNTGSASTCTVSTLSPSTASRTSGVQQLTVNGTGFTNQCVVYVNYSPQATTFVSSTQLLVPKFNPMPDSGQDGTIPIGVVKPGEKISSTVNFTAGGGGGGGTSYNETGRSVPIVAAVSSNDSYTAGSTGAAYKSALGTGASATSGTTCTITTTAAIAIGDLVVVRWAADNLSDTTPTGAITDSGGNTYTTTAQRCYATTTASSGVAGGIAATKATAAVASGGTITLTLSGAVTDKCLYANSFTGVDNQPRVVSGWQAATALTSGTSTVPAVGDLIIGAAVIESNTALSAYDTDATSGTWTNSTTAASAAGGTDSTHVSVAGQYKIATAATALSYDVTLGTSADSVAFIAVFPKTGTAPTYGGQSAVRFDASTDKYSRSATGLGTDFTMTCWVKLAVDRNAWSIILAQDNASANYYQFGANASGTQLVRDSTSGGAVNLPLYDLPIGTWVYVACVNDTAGGGMDWFGYKPAGGSWFPMQTNAGVTATGPADANTFFIGNNGFANWLNGSVAAVKIWTVALSEAELQAESYTYAPIKTSGLWAAYSFKSGPQTTDDTANARTLTAGGTLTTDSSGPPIAN